MYRFGLGGLGGVCSPSCFDAWTNKYREKQKRRQVHRVQKYSGRRIPGNCRDTVRRRDRDKCRWCGTTGTDVNALNLHHVRYRSEGGPDTPRNLLTLCFNCHKKTHTNKRKYQPVMVTLLFLYYEQNVEVTVEGSFRWIAKSPKLVDESREWSNEVLRRGSRW